LFSGLSESFFTTFHDEHLISLLQAVKSGELQKYWPHPRTHPQNTSWVAYDPIPSAMFSVEYAGAQRTCVVLPRSKHVTKTAAV